MGENSQDNTQNGAPAGGLQKKTKIAYGVGAVGKDMVYAEHGFEKKWYCVMRDPANVAEYSV